MSVPSGFEWAARRFMIDSKLSRIVFCIANVCCIHEIGCQALTAQRAVINTVTVALPCITSVVLLLQWLFVSLFHYVLYIRHTAIAEFYCVLIYNTGVTVFVREVFS